MVDRRNLLGTSAVLVGLGSALISGAGVAAADSGDATGARQADGGAGSSAPKDPSPSSSSSAVGRRGPRAPIADGGGETAASSVRGGRSSAPALDVAVPAETVKNSAPVVAAPVALLWKVSVPVPIAPGSPKAKVPAFRKVPPV